MGKVTQRDKQENWAILVCRRERENWDASELRCCFFFSVPENPPANVTAKLNGTEVLVMWEQPSGKLNGQLQGYMVEYSTPATQQVRNTFTVNKVAKFTNAFFLIMTDRFFFFQVVVNTGLGTEFAINLSVPLSNVSFRVCAYTGAGQGPWAPIQTLTLNVPGE